ncbi:hypothetical protein FND50_25265 [Rhodococcus sp. WB9]|uniref:hypothetical protein n=1 Tax=Rhodococcus sp. WB9 TaxID=2594007 RepID=UPI001185CF92|nr:hypothetical protein [Rhodococcus sp. WB9]QDQ93741.1 hypothetical protein FND50_25265 [Rhodococcus sp. WB9]
MPNAATRYRHKKSPQLVEQLRATTQIGEPMSEIQTTAASPSFDDERQLRPDGSEFWSARRLAQLTDYETWRNFAAAIERARIACENSGSPARDHFVDAGKMIELGKGGRREVADVELSRFGAYLTVMNGDPRKPAIAAAQSYFAIRTRQAEIVEKKLTELDRAKGHLSLIQMAQGLIDPKHLEAKARIVLARGLGEAPELDAATTPLYAQTFLEEKGLSKAEIKSTSPVFGKRIKAAFILEHGEEPKQYPLETGSGQIRNVNAYNESDRPLFDDVWNKYYGGAA